MHDAWEHARPYRVLQRWAACCSVRSVAAAAMETAPAASSEKPAVALLGVGLMGARSPSDCTHDVQHMPRLLAALSRAQRDSPQQPEDVPCVLASVLVNDHTIILHRCARRLTLTDHSRRHAQATRWPGASKSANSRWQLGTERLKAQRCFKRCAPDHMPLGLY